MDRCKCCVLVAGCAIIVLAVVVGEPVGPFKDTFIKDCKRIAAKDNRIINCVGVWSAFELAYVGRDPCQVPPEAYDCLMAVEPPQPMCNKMMFWSGTEEVAHQVAKGCFQTLEDTMLGSLLNNKTWCGKKGSSETFTSKVKCPGWNDCVNNPVRSFWNRASAEFAAVACGKTVVLLNGSRDNPFNSTSIFARFEVKRFKPGNMKSLTVVLVNKHKVGANCENASLKELKKSLKPGINYICKKVTESKLLSCMKKKRRSCGPCW